MDRNVAGRPMGKGVLERVQRSYRQAFEKILSKADDCDDDRGRDDDDGGDEIDKAHRDRGGSHGITGALLEHLHDELSRRRRVTGFEKASTDKEPPMNDSVEKIAVDHGVHALAKVLVDDQSAHQIDEHRFVRLVTSYAKRKYPTLTEAQAFQKVFLADDEEGRMLQRAHQITKSATAAFEVTIVDVGDETHRTVNDTESSEAYQQLEALAAKLHEAATGQGQKLTKEQAFARAFESNPELARKAHRTPVGGSTHYPMPNFNLLGFRKRGDGSQHAKADRGSNSEATAYNDLMAKAEEYRSAHPELSEAQAFAKVIQDPANRELAKRERLESAPR
jgi:hypothetical protein